jgi:predicted 3-demethylubiquinone-9 3-methyltransferase (glyoxalase superfamily)
MIAPLAAHPLTPELPMKSLALLATCLLFPAPAPAPLPATDETTMPALQKITPFLWFDDDAEPAIRFYASLFPDSQILAETRWGPGGPLPAGTLMSARVRLAGQEFMVMNGGPMHPHTEAFSMFVNCESQLEVDALWATLTSDGGEPGQCGWLKDRFGLSWQIIPSVLPALLGDKDPARAQRAGRAMMSMGKLDIAALQAAADGR